MDVDAPKINQDTGITFKRINNDNLARFLNTVTFGIIANEAIEAEITATDKGSGLKDIHYEVKDQATNAVKTSGDKTADSQGKIRITLAPEAPQANVYIVAYAVDVAGNQGAAATSANALLEANKPEAELVLGTPETDNNWYTEAVNYTLKVKDSDSGLENVRVYETDEIKTDFSGEIPSFEKDFNGETTEQEITDSTPAINTAGTHHITLVVTDKAGNEIRTSKTVKLETVVPPLSVHSYTYNEGNKEDYNSTTTGRDVYLAPSLTDNFLSGNNIVQVSRSATENGTYGDWENINLAQSGVHKITEEGDYWYQFRSISLAG
ncbi:MAG: hypothetical protein RR614_11790, partial [Eubacterium sp.]